MEFQSGRKRVLIIDDDLDVVTLVAETLRPYSIDVDRAFNGEEGLICFAQAKPDVVILDVMMPQMDGWTFLERLRQVSDVPVIILTALADGASR